MKLKKKWHGVMMVACCVAMLAGVSILAAAGSGSWLGFLVLLLCPLMHIVMHSRMHGKHEENHAKQAVLDDLEQLNAQDRSR